MAARVEFDIVANDKTGSGINSAKKNMSSVAGGGSGTNMHDMYKQLTGGGQMNSLEAIAKMMDSTLPAGVTKYAATIAMYAPQIAAGIALIKVGYEAVAFAQEQVSKGFKLNERTMATSNLFKSKGLDYDKVISDLQKASGGTVAISDLEQAAGRATLLGVDPKAFTDLMNIARQTSKVTGQEMTKAFDDITVAVGRQSKMILDNLGIIVNLEEAYDNYAEKIGKIAKDLTDEEKKEAFLNETRVKGLKMASEIGTTDEGQERSFARLSVKWQDFTDKFAKLMASELGPLFAKMAESIASMLDGLIKIMDLFEEGKLGEKIKDILKDFLTASFGDELGGFLIKSFEVAFETLKESFKMLDEATEAFFKVFEEVAQATFKLIWEYFNGVVKTAFQLMMGDWDGAWNQMKETVTNMANIIKEAFTNIWDILKNMFTSVAEILKPAIDAITHLNSTTEAVSQKISNMASKAGDVATTVAGGVAGGTVDIATSAFSKAKGLFTSDDVAAKALGGVFSGGFRAFASGGIATGPTLGLVGEGQFNEAVVPLPNGEAIPVDMKNATVLSSETLMALTGGLGGYATGGGIEGGINAEKTARELAKVKDEFREYESAIYSASYSLSNGMTNAFQSVINGSKKVGDAFRDMASQVLAEVSRMLMSKALTSFFGMIAGNATSALGGSMGLTIPATALGGVFSHGVKLFGKGGVVKGPTLFPMANGMGLMGEDGAEAVMPLSRGRGGKLGVVASGLGGGGGNVMNFQNSITIENGGQMANDPDKMDKFTKMIGSEIRNQVKMIIMDERRVNGMLNPSTMRRTA